MKPLEQLGADRRRELEASLAPPLPSNGAGAYAHYHKAVDWDLYHDVARQIGVPHSMPAGLVAHFAGQSGDKIDVFDLWSDFETMDEFFAFTLAESITNSLAEVERRNDVEPEHERIKTVAFGEAARAFIDSRGDSAITDFFERDQRPLGFFIGEANADAAAYVEACSLLGVPGLIPSGMIAQLVDQTDSRTVVFEAWQDARAAASWHEAFSDQGLGIEFPVRSIDLMRIALRPELFS